VRGTNVKYGKKREQGAMKEKSLLCGGSVK